MNCIWKLHVWVPFNVLSSSAHTLISMMFSLHETVLVCFFYDGFQLLSRIRLNLRNHFKSPSFEGVFKFWEQERVTRSKIKWVEGGEEQWSSVWPKLTSSEFWVGWSVVVMEKPVVTSPQFWPFVSDGVNLVDCGALRKILVVN